jgi:hypothetical protein
VWVSVYILWNQGLRLELFWTKFQPGLFWRFYSLVLLYYMRCSNMDHKTILSTYFRVLSRPRIFQLLSASTSSVSTMPSDMFDDVNHWILIASFPPLLQGLLLYFNSVGTSLIGLWGSEKNELHRWADP